MGDVAFVGVDLHKRRSVIVQLDDQGERVGVARIENSPIALADAVGKNPGEVVIEATCGWYWAADTVTEAGGTVHLANPLGLRWGHRRVKNDLNDATDLADMLRLDRLPEAWLAPPAVRELRELVRYRMKLVNLRSNLKAQVQAVLVKQGVMATRYQLWGPRQARVLAEANLDSAFAARVDSLLRLVGAITLEQRRLDKMIAAELADDAGYRAIQTIRGVGPVLAAIFVAEIGDVTRFPNPNRLASWAGLTPRHRESDTTVHRGHITKMGSPLVRWAAVEAISRGRDTSVAALYGRVQARRGTNIARVAAARKLLQLVYYGLRDGEIRCLAQAS